MKKSRPVLRQGNPHDASSIVDVVNRYGYIEQKTLIELCDLLIKHTKYNFHIELAIETGALLKTIDNEKDARQTIENLKNKYEHP